jgi:adenosylmethionine-8-amino-7-oxononanoate aminotransferase
MTKLECKAVVRHMQRKTASLAERDKAFVLHQYTNLKFHHRRGPLVIERGDGIYVEDSDGHRHIEAMAGLWSVALGFSEARLVDAAVRQMVPAAQLCRPQLQDRCAAGPAPQGHGL